MKKSQENKKIRTLDADAMVQCRKRWNSLAKPIHGLGRLEDLIVQVAGIQRTADIRLERKALLVLCADNGVTAEGVTQTGQEVTAVVARNFLTGQTTACIMAERAGADVYPIDVGMAEATPVRRLGSAYGTKNMRWEPAMTRAETEAAIQTGIDLVREKKEQGYHILATGEMGIGNTTTSSATASVLLGIAPEAMTGRGAGLDEQGYARKKQVISEAIMRHQPDPSDPVDVLSKIGGFDLAGLTGVFLGGAIYEMPIIIDGFISSVAALAAVCISPVVKNYMMASHVSGEPAAAEVLQALELKPVIHGQMSLGEGTGALTLYPLLDMAADVYQKMCTFQETSIEPYNSVAD